MHVDLCLNAKRFSRDEVLAKLPEIRRVMEKHAVRAAYLFGSALADRMGPFSDVDIAVLLDPPGSDWLETHGAIYADLCRIFQADNIDVILLSEAPPSLRFTVIQDGLLFYAADEQAWGAFVEETIFSYHDVQPLREEEWHYLVQHIKLGLSKELNMIDRERVKRFIVAMRDAVHELKGLGLESMTFEAYANNKPVRALSEHYLRIAIEAAMDLGRHVLAAKGLKVPEEYRKIGPSLSEGRIVPAELGEKLMAMAGLRNILVHLYWDIDYRRIYHLITSELDVFDRYARCILDLLEREAEEGAF